MYTRPKAAQEKIKVRQAPIQTVQQDRDFVRKYERLAACGNPRRPMPESLLLSHPPRSTRNLLAMMPEPNFGLLSHLRYLMVTRC